MSKRPSNVQSTLLNFFTKSPSTSQTNGHTKPKPNPPTPNGTPKRIKKEETKIERSPCHDEDDEIVAPKKRRRIIVNDDSSDSDSDSSPEPVESENPESEPSIKPLLTKFDFNAPAIELPEIEKPDEFDEYIEDEREDSDSESHWAHETFTFLHRDFIKDKNGNRPGSDNYNPRTLYVPEDFLKQQTPAMRQWWVFKRDNFDCVLFFKVGKFYELYHMDAVIGVQYLGFSFMKGEFAHSGFPEIGYGKFSKILVDLGFKVARVEQTETPEMLAERKRTATKSDQSTKVVSREICQVSSKGTKIQSVQDVEITKAMAQYLLAINEHRYKNEVEFGVCFVDTSIGTVHVGQFKDTVELTKLVALISEFTPVAILEEKGNLGRYTKRVFKCHLEGVKYETLDSQYEFPPVEKVVHNLLKQNYYGTPQDYPQVLKDLFENGNVRSPYKKETKLALRSVGAIQYFLENCKLDIQIFSMGRIVKYIPPSDISMIGKYMLLDGSTLQNLHLLGGPGSLQYNIDRCITPMGKRLLKQWICHPLCDSQSIEERLTAVSEIRVSQSIEDIRDSLRALPDLERCLAQIHSFGNKLKSELHPDSRAIFYEEKIYSKKKVQNFISLINAFKSCISLIKDVNSQVKKSTLIQYYTTFETSGGCFPDILEILKYYEKSFDHEKAIKDGVIIPQDGMDEEYDASKKEIADINKAANRYLEKYEKMLGCKLSFFGRDKKRFQMEVPERHCHKLPKEFVFESQKKDCKRFYSSELKDFLADIMRAEKKNREILLDLNRRIFSKFTDKYDVWMQVINCVATIDVLYGIAVYTENQNMELVRPIFSDSQEPKLIIKEGIHPFIPIDDFVPNDTILGGPKQPILILSGPNMGGKSTLMRQVGIIAIMAQLGLYIPAQYCELTIIDKMFTRLGARDDIMTGASTFDVELRESLSILNNATKKSLVLLDELGRGTSTYDGTAIAAAYVGSLTKISCRTIFSTHYSYIINLYKRNPAIQMGHMACKVEKLKEDIKFDDITFTYKLAPGGSDKSYGLNAARLAGIPIVICENALKFADHIEATTAIRSFLRSLNEEDCDKIREKLESIDIESLNPDNLIF